MLQTIGKYVRKADLRERPIETHARQTYYGAFETVAIACIVIGFFGWFFADFVNQTTVSSDTEPSDGIVYAITLQCVSLGGCNVTYDFPSFGPCSQLSNIAPKFYNDSEIFTVQICRNAFNANAGVTVRSIFDQTKQWYPPRDKLHIIELLQRGRANIPLSKITGFDTTTVQFSQRVDKDGSHGLGFGDTTVQALQWEPFSPGTAASDTICFNVLSISYPLVCGSYRLQPSPFVVDRKLKLANNARGDVFAPVVAISGVLAWFSSKIARYSCCKCAKVAPYDIQTGIAKEVEMTDTMPTFQSSSES
jgi:hypothetical protein